MARTLLRGGRVLDPASGRDEIADVLIDGERIAGIGEDLITPGEPVSVINVEGKLVTPGLIDIHVHLREPGQEHKETIETGAAAAVAGGFTSVVCMPNTSPALDVPERIGFVRERAAEAALAKVFPVGAITMGLGGEELTDHVALREAGAIAFSDDGRYVVNSRVMRRSMDIAAELDVPYTLHSIDENMPGAMNEGEVSRELGVSGSPASAEHIAVFRDIELAELTGARIHVGHVSTRRAVDLIRGAQQRGVRVTGEVSPHHLTLTQEALRSRDTNFKMNPPLRTEADRQAVLMALAHGVLTAIATDHAPHHKDEKALGLEDAPNGVIGLETAAPVTWTALVEKRLLEPLDWVRLLTRGPAEIMGLPGGELRAGGPADIAVLDPKATREVSDQTFRGKSRNSCFFGRHLTCWPTMTFVDGRRVFG